MSLEREQQELLSAHLDGEVTDTERAVAEQLLQGEEGRHYASQLSQTRNLVQIHAAANAPAGLMQRVVFATRGDCDDISRPGGPASIRKLPRLKWRAPLAAAAAVAIALGVVFGGSWFGPDAGPPPRVAKTTHPPRTGQTPAGELHAAGKSALPKHGEGGNPADPVARPPAVPSPERGHADELNENEGADEEPAQLDSRDAEKLAALNGRHAANDAREHRTIDLSRGADTPLELSIQLDRRNSAPLLQVYNDVLLVSALYGDAEVKDGPTTEEDGAETGTDFSAFDRIEVELDERKLSDLLAALRRLARDQNYGRLVIPADLKREVRQVDEEVVLILAGLEEAARAPKRALKDRPNGDIVREPRPSAPRAASYLPAEIRRRALEAGFWRRGAPEPEPDKLKSIPDPPPAPGEKGAAEGQEVRKIRLVIRLQ